MFQRQQQFYVVKVTWPLLSKVKNSVICINRSINEKLLKKMYHGRLGRGPLPARPFHWTEGVTWAQGWSFSLQTRPLLTMNFYYEHHIFMTWCVKSSRVTVKRSLYIVHLSNAAGRAQGTSPPCDSSTRWHMTKKRGIWCSVLSVHSLQFLCSSNAAPPPGTLKSTQ